MNRIFAHVRLLLDIWSVRVFVSVFSLNGELLDSHLFFYVRYSELADYHRSRGRIAKAEKLDAIAETHYQAAPGDDDPPEPEEVAMAMPVPQPLIRTNAVGATRMKHPRTEWPGGFTPAPTS
jgi:hypothetical protein